jgi:DnaK suppressor protein
VTPLDVKTMAGLRSTLEEQRATLRREILAEGGDPDSDDAAHLDLERGFADSAHMAAERARLIAVMGGLRANLKDVERALTKMEAGRYGTCERCGDPISPERLEALPSARLCISCKQRTGRG